MFQGTLGLGLGSSGISSLVSRFPSLTWGVCFIVHSYSFPYILGQNATISAHAKGKLGLMALVFAGLVQSTLVLVLCEFLLS